MEHWPPLAWVARCGMDEPVNIFHGPMVEIGEDWFGEMVWDGDFADGDFDLASHRFGSGGKIRDGRMQFVGSSSVLDRLHWCRNRAELFVSNSIVALTKWASMQADPHRTDYPALFRSICRGVEDYQRSIPMRHGEVRLAYMTSLDWDGHHLRELPRRQTNYDLHDYDSYRSAIDGVMKALVSNGKDHRRRHPFDLISTISTGYDSPAATALARKAGAQNALTITSGRSGDSDDGTGIGTSLGVSVPSVSRNAWRNEPLIESLFISGDAKGEDVYVAGAQACLHQKILFTGYGGTRVWGVKKSLHEQFQRGDQSGLSHCEARLHLGYVHIPVPFLVASQPAELRRISKSEAMRPWHVEGSYNCPLARRIVEDAGVGRNDFGMKKKAASVLLFDRESFLSEQSSQDFESWCAEHFHGTRAIRPFFHRLMVQIGCRALSMLRVAARTMAKRTGSKFMSRVANSSRLDELIQHEPSYRYLFPWALDRVQCRYPQESPLRESSETT